MKCNNDHKKSKQRERRLSYSKKLTVKRRCLPACLSMFAFLSFAHLLWCHGYSRWISVVFLLFSFARCLSLCSLRVLQQLWMKQLDTLPLYLFVAELPLARGSAAPQWSRLRTWQWNVPPPCCLFSWCVLIAFAQDAGMEGSTRGIANRKHERIVDWFCRTVKNAPMCARFLFCCFL